MSEKGYTYTDPLNYDEGFADDMDEAAIEGVYSYNSPENAALYGVSTPSFALSIKKSKADPSLPEGYLDTLVGKDEKDLGCMGKGFEIFGNTDERKRQLTQSVAEIRLKVLDQAEPLRLKLEKKWAACMADAGLSQYTTIEKIATKDGGEELWPDGDPSAEQVKVAKTSGECMISTGYLEEYSKHQAQIGHAYAQKNPGVITEWKKVHQAEIEAATASLKGK
ncbi:MAG: hypothetical protein Q4B10_07005 [Actinomycetaceae bacterium]|nr:hypothetical protein [Actinomycetaceae bacterium]